MASRSTPLGLVPGDTVQRTVTLSRSTDTDSFGSVKVTTTATTNNLLTSDATNGLQLKIDQCSVAWVKPAGNDLTCSGVTTPVVAQRAVIGTNLDLAAATTALNAVGATSNLRVTLTLPTAADNAFQGLNEHRELHLRRHPAGRRVPLTQTPVRPPTASAAARAFNPAPHPAPADSHQHQRGDRP